MSLLYLDNGGLDSLRPQILFASESSIFPVLVYLGIEGRFKSALYKDDQQGSSVTSKSSAYR